MSAPQHGDKPEAWTAWVEQVAPYRGPTAAEVPVEIRALAAIKDREIAALAARGICAELRKRGQKL